MYATRQLQACADAPPTARAAAADAAVAAPALEAVAPAAASSQQTTPQQILQQPLQQQQQQQPEVLSKETLKSIKAGRRRFLKHQSMVDGSLEVMDSPQKPYAFTTRSPSPGPDDDSRAARRRAKQQLQPTYVVEAVADLLLDELLFGQVDELESFCDALCSQIFDEEFVDA
jgi:hypothetical protein